jgi:N-acylneuraminate cytidylyltransferase
LLPYSNGATPWHNSQYAAFPELYAQNASLQIAWSRVPLEPNSTAGRFIIPLI